MRRDKSRGRRLGGAIRSAPHTERERVAWLGAATRLDSEARVVYEAVVKADLTRYDDVVTYVADSLYAEDQERIGSDGGIGLFREWYRMVARTILRRLDGTVIAIEHDTRAANAR